MATSALATVGTIDSNARPETVKELWDQYQLHLQATLPLQQAQQAMEFEYHPLLLKLCY